MPILGWGKLRTAAALHSGALRADAYETIVYSWLSLTTLAGLILNAALGWRWADPPAALAIVPLLPAKGKIGGVSLRRASDDATATRFGDRRSVLARLGRDGWCRVCVGVLA
jgi:hypothetical protein